MPRLYGQNRQNGTIPKLSDLSKATRDSGYRFYRACPEICDNLARFAPAGYLLRSMPLSGRLAYGCHMESLTIMWSGTPKRIEPNCCESGIPSIESINASNLFLFLGSSTVWSSPTNGSAASFGEQLYALCSSERMTR
jgi:hypothetical protein